MHSNLELAVIHLNASVGPVLKVDQLASALRAGSTHHVVHDATAAALISSLFNELSPDLILQGAAEAGADVHRVHQLYREALADNLPPVPAWEKAVEPFL